MSAATMLSAACEGAGCDTMVWMMPEDDGADIEALVDDHLRVIADEEGDRWVLLCDGCSELLTSGGVRPPQWTLDGLDHSSGTGRLVGGLEVDGGDELEPETGLGL